MLVVSLAAAVVGIVASGIGLMALRTAAVVELLSAITGSIAALAYLFVADRQLRHDGLKYPK